MDMGTTQSRHRHGAGEDIGMGVDMGMAWACHAHGIDMGT